MEAFDPNNTPPRPATASRPAPWGQRLRRVWGEIGSDHVSMMAAALAFYGLLAIFPGMSALISLFGLVANARVIENHVGSLAGFLPGEALRLLTAQLHALAAAPPAKLGLGLVTGLVVSLWSGVSGAAVLMETLTIAYEDDERRGLVRFYGTALLLTLGMAAFALAVLFLIAGVPILLAAWPLLVPFPAAAALLRWPLAAAAAILALAFLYRFAPNRRHPHWSLLKPGTLAAGLIWVAGSAAFSFYVTKFGSYDRTYGSMGAVIVLMMWLYLSAYVTLVGAELNAEFEHHDSG